MITGLIFKPLAVAVFAAGYKVLLRVIGRLPFGEFLLRKR